MSPRSERDRATFIGCSGGRSISGISFSFLTKLGASETVDFLLQASTRRRKEEAGEGGGDGSPPWAAMAAHSKPYRNRARSGACARFLVLALLLLPSNIVSQPCRLF
jgi:hypothetical protein